ncbi:MAG: histidine--tRNA ligase [Nitrospinaceae bacterium]|nr:MAG: histidine--tRNA ligase [Nitrospinaceae bacterium]
MKIQSIRGVRDILPGEIEKWQWVERIAQHVFKRYGFQEIRLPVFEKTALFSRSIGETTDIVEKEMYTFADRGGEQITLRPEGTASVVRAYIEHKLYNPPSVLKLYYLGPMFRYERPQAGRFRQFYQIGIEAMGSASPLVDVEVMTLLLDFFQQLGITGLKLEINSLGCPECRPVYREALKAAIRPHLPELCANCTQRYERNPLRVLDCKVERDREIAATLPRFRDHWCAACQENFTEVCGLLDAACAPYSINPLLVRGLDYYSRTTFEVVSGNLGAQNAVCGGGRYDSLVEEFDGPPTPCFGFALGMERLISLLPDDNSEDLRHRPDVFIVALGDAAARVSIGMAARLRGDGFSVERDYDGGSMKSQMRKANRAAARLTLIVGDNEIAAGKYTLKNMENGEQREIEEESLSAAVTSILNSEPDGD